MKPFPKLNKAVLQIIAAIAMTVDHLAWFFFPGYPRDALPILLHVFGRLAFPIFAFFIAEGYHYTRNKNRYMLRILLFAALSHVPYMFASNQFLEYGPLCFIPFATGNGIGRFLNQGSVLFSYFIGLAMLRVNDSPKFKEWQKVIIVLFLCLFSFPCDWSCIGSLVVLSIGSNRGKPIKQIVWSFVWILLYGLVYSLALDWVYGIIQLGVVLALPLLFLYNGQKSNHPFVNRFMRHFLYLYYPLHLTAIGLLYLL